MNPKPRCGQCGYIVHGLPGSICPECGSDLTVVGLLAPNLRKNLRTAGIMLVWTVIAAILGPAIWHAAQPVLPRHYTLHIDQTLRSNFDDSWSISGSPDYSLVVELNGASTDKSIPTRDLSLTIRLQQKLPNTTKRLLRTAEVQINPVTWEMNYIDQYGLPAETPLSAINLKEWMDNKLVFGEEGDADRMATQAYDIALQLVATRSANPYFPYFISRGDYLDKSVINSAQALWAMLWLAGIYAIYLRRGRPKPQLQPQ